MKAGRSEVEISIDEQPGKAKLDKIPTLRPAFRDGGTVTAANSSSISDGAAALVLMRASEAEKRGLTHVRFWSAMRPMPTSRISTRPPRSAP